MGGFARTIATAFVWAAAASILIFSDIDLNNAVNLVIVLVAALFATAAVWDVKQNASKSDGRINTDAMPEKAKRSENRWLARMIDSLSDEDIAVLEARLASRRNQLDEDEQIELNRLLADPDRQRR